MENAHLRLGLLEYVRITEKAAFPCRHTFDRFAILGGFKDTMNN